MCNTFEQQVAWKAYCDYMQAIALRIPTRQTELDLPQIEAVRISDICSAIVMPEPGVVELVPMRFSYPPEPGRGPVFNVRSEGRDYSKSNRCLIPASAFFEFTAPADLKQKRKDKWRFNRADGEWMGLPAIWRPGQGNQPPGFALPTVDPGPDIAPIHNRQIVVLNRQDWRRWLEDPSAPGPRLLRPSPAGKFQLTSINP
ncbi:MAG TPA: SOS response-associated peptidase family protein [Caulobacteraceae bacterium]|jgi:putative SOS response-associated peptidase YedK